MISGRRYGVVKETHTLVSLGIKDTTRLNQKLNGQLVIKVNRSNITFSPKVSLTNNDVTSTIAFLHAYYVGIRVLGGQ